MAIFGPEEDKWWIWRSKTPTQNQLKMPFKQGKRNETTTRLITGTGLELGKQLLQNSGKNAKRTHGSIFTLPSLLPPHLEDDIRRRGRMPGGSCTCNTTLVWADMSAPRTNHSPVCLPILADFLPIFKAKSSWVLAKFCRFWPILAGFFSAILGNLSHQKLRLKNAHLIFSRENQQECLSTLSEISRRSSDFPWFSTL